MRSCRASLGSSSSPLCAPCTTRGLLLPHLQDGAVFRPRNNTHLCQSHKDATKKTVVGWKCAVLHMGFPILRILLRRLRRSGSHSTPQPSFSRCRCLMSCEYKMSHINVHGRAKSTQEGRLPSTSSIARTRGPQSRLSNSSHSLVTHTHRLRANTSHSYQRVRRQHSTCNQLVTCSEISHEIGISYVTGENISSKETCNQFQCTFQIKLSRTVNRLSRQMHTFSQNTNRRLQTE